MAQQTRYFHKATSKFGRVTERKVHKMKNVKRVLGMLLATIMVLTMSLTAFATDVKMDGKANKYAAFKLMDRITNPNDPDAFVYKVNPKYRDALLDFVTVDPAATDAEKDAAILKYLEDQGKAGPDAVRTFADALFALIDVTAPEAALNTATDGYTFTGLEEGYYMFVETEPAEKEVNGDIETTDEISQVMLAPVFGDTMTVEAKEDEVTSDKKTRDINDSTETTSTGWQDSGDYDIGDTVPYRLSATVSANYDAYDFYYFKFIDEIGTGLTITDDQLAAIEVRLDAEDGQNITSSFTIARTANGFTAECTDLKTIAGVKAGSKIFVLFDATLNKNAVIGVPGNPNKSRVEFSNNPYDEKKHGFTPWDIVIVFTYKLVVNKVDGNQEPLEGAGFTLYKFNAETREYEAVGAEMKGDQMKTFVWKGIDDGIYKLVETTVPAGFNKADDIEFQVVAEHEIIADEPKLTSLKVVDMQGNEITGTFSVTLESGSIETDVVNNSGVELPKTGGIGTTIFTVLGALLMLGAGVVLVTRRRLQK